MKIGDQPVFSIGAVAQMLDMPTSTIRAWEDRYGIVVPSRSEGAQRLYSQAQVEQLRFIKRQTEAGKSAADAHRLLSQELQGKGTESVRSQMPERRPLILIAERDTYAAQLAEHFLRTEGYGAAIALDGLQARLQFEERSPDLVILDLLISGGAGFRLCREFTDKGKTVLAVSALHSQDEAVLVGASAFLPKPVQPLQLVSIVKALLKTSALTASPAPEQVAR